MGDGGGIYVFPIHNVAVETSTDVVTGQSVKHIGSIRGREEGGLMGEGVYDFLILMHNVGVGV